MTIISETKEIKLKFIFDNINIETPDNTLKTSYLSGTLLLKINEETPLNTKELE
eukprot:GDKH01003461.1.p1 GENE.GDKH01003461.1~~GDKH01003461.1.p1  ORF type:complete len:61 (-),score=5.90 GDKH01003461.1:105-266(-)